MHFKSYLVLSFALLSASIGHAEVTLDGSVGLVNAGDPVSSGNGYTYNITADLGEQAGANLFHSFDKFNIDTGELAHFSGPASIVNIVSRVTGGESSISGEITSSISGASLWLVNPAGFIFTNGAVVDVDGNFHLSSAEYLEFADGARFFSNLSPMSTLSTGEIASFGFLGSSTGAIKIDGTSATTGEVNSLEHNLTVNSDFVSIRDANLYAQEISIGMNSQNLSNINVRDSLLETNGGGIFFEGGRIFAVNTVIAGYGSEGISDGATVRLTAPAITLSNVEMRGETKGLGSGSDILFGATTISIGNGSTIDVSSSSTLDSAGDAGTISISAQDVDIVDTEFLLDTLGGGLGGALTIEATDISLSQTSIKAQTEGLGEAGQTSMRGETIAWSDVAVNASSSGAGVGGSIVLSADNISIAGGSVLESDSFGSGDGGEIILTANSAFNLTNARIEAEVRGSGTGGLVEIKSPEIALGQDSEINISALSGTGDAGVLTIAGTTITAVNANIKGETFGEGEGADIALTADDISLSGTLINSSTEGVGAGGFIALNADTISIVGGSALESDSFGSGAGGEIILTANSAFNLANARIEAEVGGSGAGGLVEIKSPEIALGQDGEINISALSGTGDAGVLTIAGTTITAVNADIKGETFGEGEGSDIALTADDISLSGTLINSSTKGVGTGGFIVLNADTISIVGGSALESDSFSSGDGGEIIFSADSAFNLTNARIEAEALGSGAGGLVEIKAPEIALGQDSEINISALSGSGDAGVLNITGTSLALDNSLIATKTLTVGNAGQVTLTADAITATDSTIQGETLGAGQGADIFLLAADISLTGTRLDSSTLGSGAGGFIRLSGSAVLVDGSTLITETEGAGKGGTIFIAADRMDILNQGNLNGRSSGGSGDAGSISISTGELNIDNGLITLVTTTPGSGGDLVIDTGTLRLNQSTLSASANSDGNAGRIEIAAVEGSLLNNSVISSDTTGNGVGGDILIKANKLNIFSQAGISSSATGASDAGDVTLLVPEILQIVGGSIQTTSALSGGGSINIQTLNRIRIDQSIISASANGVTESSGGGNINIDPELFTIRQSQIVAQANAGTGGNIDLVADNFLADTETLISASSQRGIDGTVEIESPNQSVNPVSADLDTGFQALPDFISNNCKSSSLQDRSYLIVDNMNPVRRDPAGYLPAPLAEATAIPHTQVEADLVRLVASRGC